MRPILITAMCLLLAACGGAGTGGLSPIAAQADIDRFGIDVLPVDPVQDASFGNILNDLRIDIGGNEVTYDARLDAAAQAHADDMLARGYFNHTNPEGETERDRIQAQGYNPSSWGENLARSQPSEADVLVAWINSPEHNRLLRAGTVDEFGLGVAGSGADRHWVLVMARER